MAPQGPTSMVVPGCENLNNSCVNGYGPIAVQVIDQYGAPVVKIPVAWAVTEGSGNDDPNSDSVTNQNGVAGAAVYLVQRARRRSQST